MPDLRGFLKCCMAVAILALVGCASDQPIFFPETAPEVAAEPAPAPAPAPAPQAARPAKPSYGAMIGLLLPLSGKNASLGRALHQAAEMGLFEVGDDTFRLMVENTAPPSNPELAARALLSRDVDILLGPVFGADLKRIASIASNAKVPVLAFTNDVTLAQPGIYVLGVAPRMEVNRVAGFALSQGMRRIAILAPNSPYGTLVLASLRETVERLGGSLGQAAFYDPGAGDFASAIQVLVQAERTVGFDALLIAEGGARLRQIAPLLIDSGLDPARVRMLGTGLWQNDPGLNQEPGLAGGWYPALAPERWLDFAARYRDAFGGEPDPRASLVHDATTLAIQLGKVAKGREYSAASLTDPDGFVGAGGIFRLMAGGTTERGMAILELGAGGPSTRDPAPPSFVPQVN